MCVPCVSYPSITLPTCRFVAVVVCPNVSRTSSRASRHGLCLFGPLEALEALHAVGIAVAVALAFVQLATRVVRAAQILQRCGVVAVVVCTNVSRPAGPTSRDHICLFGPLIAFEAFCAMRIVVAVALAFLQEALRMSTDSQIDQYSAA